MARLLLRRWRDRDRGPFAALNADAEVMRFFVERQTRAQSDALIASFEAHFDEHGFGLWALELEGTNELLGFTGLNVVSFAADFTPAVEVGWRLRRSAWGHGYATEAALAALRHGYEEHGLEEIVAFAVLENCRSHAVMQRIGMTRERGGDFDHPLVPREHPLRRHLLYRRTAADWRARPVRPRAVIVDRG